MVLGVFGMGVGGVRLIVYLCFGRGWVDVEYHVGVSGYYYMSRAGCRHEAVMFAWNLSPKNDRHDGQMG